MEIEEIVGKARDAVGVRRVYGEPYEQNGVTVIPAAVIRGGSGGGGGEGTEGEAEAGDAAAGRRGSGGGAGFGLSGRPAGAFVIENGEARWQPAVDATAIVMRALVLGAATFLISRAFDRHRG